MKKYNTVEDLYTDLDNAIDSYTSESIGRETFLKRIDEINQNEFGIVIDKNLVTSNRDDFNEQGMVSYTEESSYEDYDDNY